MTANAIGNSVAKNRYRKLRVAWWNIRKSFSSQLGLLLVVLMLLLAVFGPWVVPYPDDVLGAVHLSKKLLPPSYEHWFGTDEVGNDILTRVVVGARISLLVGISITVLAAAVGIPLGIIAGASGGIVREVIMRINDVFLAVPGLAIAIAIVAALGPGIENTVIALVLVWWPGYARLAEAKALSIKEQAYIEAAKVLGSTSYRILWRHILPNSLSPLIIKMSIDVGQAILAVASLGFIGLGAKPPTPEWGAMIAVSRGYMPDFWWYAFFPGLFLFFAVLGFNLLGDALRDILDPRSSR